MQIACACDERYAPHLAAMLHSLWSHEPGAVVHFLHGADLTRSVIDGLRTVASTCGGELQCHRIADPRLARLPTQPRFQSVVWHRVFLPELLPEADRVLYLDADTLVQRALRELWAVDLRGHQLGAVPNVFEPAHAARPAALGLASTADYFNSGVLLMDLAAMRASGFTQRVIEVALTHSREHIWPDQDALNVVLAGRWRRLHPRWNCQNSFFVMPQAASALVSERLVEALRDPGILHFEGPPVVKPWHYLSAHPFRQVYLQHAGATPWGRPRLEGRTLANVLRKRVLWPARKLARSIRGRLAS